MTTFQSVNVALGSTEPHGEATTPTTPRAAPHFEVVSRPPPMPAREESEATTPTRNSFAAANGKRALPVSPFQSTFAESQLSRHDEQGAEAGPPDSQRSARSKASQDIDRDGSDIGEDGSDAESAGDEDERPSKKKKKGQRFFCTEFPPCNLSFTRSEHLARHIRKHTGERPFQCHCSRRFSRLDNLRQHAQTVHMNEDIPGDSLAATGTRFQRQIRTDRVRPPGRSRTSTGSASGPHGHRHSRNLSTSSNASNASTMSTLSTMSTMSHVSHDPVQRRPHSLTLAEQMPQRGGLTIDTLRASPQAGAYTFGNRSPAEASTPTSTSYANTPNSPFSSTLGSPVSIPRHAGPLGERPPSRRLSVPSGTSPFIRHHHHHSHHGGMPAPLMHNPLNPSNSSFNSSNSSLLTSPTGSVHSFGPKDPAASHAAAAEELRRRTWHHSSTYSNYSQPRPATSGLTFSQTPDAPRPAFAPQAVAAAGQMQRLPGFETFDQISQRPLTPTSTASARSSVFEPSQPATPQRPAPYSAASDRGIPGPPDRRGHASWDLSLHQNLTKLDITAGGTPPRESYMQWTRSDAHAAAPPPQQQPPLAGPTNQSGAFTFPSAQQTAPPQQQPPPPPNHAQHNQQHPPQHPVPSQNEGSMSAEPSAPLRAKRAGWYNGPLPLAPAPAASAPHAVGTAQPARPQGPVHGALQPHQQAPPPQQQPQYQLPSQQQHPYQPQQPQAQHRRRSPEDSSSSDGVPTPSSTSLEYQPSILHPNGYVEAQAPVAPKPVTNFSHPFTVQSAHHAAAAAAQPANRVVPAPRKDDLHGLDALCAAAEREGQAVVSSAPQ